MTARAALRVALAAVSLLAAADRALAHAHLRSATPPADGTVRSAPAAIEITFTEAIEPAFSGARVSGPDGRTVPLGKPSLGSDGKALVVPLPGQPLPAGSYRVDWHVLSTDGHKTSGSYGFSVSP